jgi:hypothetical protein
MLLAALLSATAMLMITDWYVHALSDGGRQQVFFGTLAAVTAAGVLLAATGGSSGAVPVLNFALTIFAGALAYLALTPWACTDSIPPECSSAFGVALLPYSTPLPAALGGLGVGAAVWLLLSLVASRQHDASRTSKRR